MRIQSGQVIALAVGILALGACTPPANATVPATGTRLAIGGGGPRFYMTYGHMRDAELYAPVTQELRRLGLSFQRRDATLVVYARGKQVAEWPIVYTLEQVPDTGSEAVALNLGGNLFVPIRHLAGLTPFQVFWNRDENIVTLNLAGPRRAPTPSNGVAPRTGQAPELNGVEFTPGVGGTVVRIRTSRPVVPRVLHLTVAPPRVVLDFPGATWIPGVAVPAPQGEISAVRTGHPETGVARLAMEVSGTWVRVRTVRVDRNEVRCLVGTGNAYSHAEVTPAARQQLEQDGADAAVRAAIQRRAQMNPRIASRTPSGPLEGAEPGPGEAIPIPNPNEIPSRLPPLQVQPASHLVGKIIVVDAGHGGADSGARGARYTEKELALKAALALRQALEARGALVIMTREADVAVELTRRPALANREQADLFISIHCNSSASSNTARGVETYWHWRRPGSRRLAQALHRRLVLATGNNDRGVRSNRDLCVTRESGMPSVLLELGFIDNPQDEAQLASPDFQRLLAEELTLGVLEFFGTDLPPSG